MILLYLWVNVTYCQNKTVGTTNNIPKFFFTSAHVYENRGTCVLAITPFFELLSECQNSQSDLSSEAVF